VRNLPRRIHEHLGERRDAVNGRPNFNAASCTVCHGDASRTGADPFLAAMPPAGADGEMASTSVAVGAHVAHLTAGPLARALSCTDCHAVPPATPHPNGSVDFHWSVLAKGTGTPSYDTTGHTCSSTYCHGSFASGNPANLPSWSGGATQAACGTCHGTPPAAPHVQNPDCGRCHVGYTATT
jgi:predicted CxxxxCH...CXXCH cytochrome family protein